MIFVAVGAGLVWYFEHEKERMQKKRIAEANKAIGKPKVGGAFKLVDHNGNPYTDSDMKGRYSLVRTAGWIKSSLALHQSLLWLTRAVSSLRSTSVSLTAPTFARRNSIKWPTCTILSRNSYQAL